MSRAFEEVAAGCGRIPTETIGSAFAFSTPQASAGPSGLSQEAGTNAQESRPFIEIMNGNGRKRDRRASRAASAAEEEVRFNRVPNWFPGILPRLSIVAMPVYPLPQPSFPILDFPWAEILGWSASDGFVAVGPARQFVRSPLASW
eukprot:scaffold57553_cov44-Prasinocladus_malaysianus.AAC.2